MAKPKRNIRLNAPYLRHVELMPERVKDWDAYPFCLPLFRSRDFELAFDHPVTVIVGENGSGKSTLLEGIATAAGFGSFGGNIGHSPASTRRPEETLAPAFKIGWLPKIARGFFFRAETFFDVAHYAEEVALEAAKYVPTGPPPDWLYKSHGEGFLGFFSERGDRQGIYIFDEPESALSPTRQIDFMRILRRMEKSGIAQIIMATHSPFLMAYPGARLLMLDKYGLTPIELRDTTHFRMMREFCLAPEGYVEAMLDE